MNFNFTYDWAEIIFEEFSEVTSIELDITVPARTILEIRIKLKKLDKSTEIIFCTLSRPITRKVWSQPHIHQCIFCACTKQISKIFGILKIIINNFDYISERFLITGMTVPLLTAK